MAETADAIPGLDWADPPNGLAPVGRFLHIYNRQLSYAVPAMEEWWVFGGFLSDLPSAAERNHAAQMLRRLAAANGEMFDRLCSEIEALAAPAWCRRMRVRPAACLDEIRHDQTGARLAALASIAARLGWETGDEVQATGFGTRRTEWRFSPRGIADTMTLAIRVGPPSRPEAASDPVDLDFALAPDEAPSVGIHLAFRHLAEFTALAAESETLVDLPLIRRLEALRER